MKLEIDGGAFYKDGEKQYEFDSFEHVGDSLVFFKGEVEVGSANASLVTMVERSAAPAGDDSADEKFTYPEAEAIVERMTTLPEAPDDEQMSDEPVAEAMERELRSDAVALAQNAKPKKGKKK